jgi:hypothetical protein
MATFDVIAKPEDLPPEGTRESPTLEFKAELCRLKVAGTPDYFELAKDIASMASVYGGALLLGALGGSQLAKYKPLSECDANEVCEAYQTAARDRCVPTPLITTEKIPVEGGFVVAVNVFPILDRPVAVRVRPIDAERFGSPAWAYIFPVRLSTHAIPYSPENLPMLLNPGIRRTIILLESIPEEGREKVLFTWIAWTDHEQATYDGARHDSSNRRRGRECQRVAGAAGALVVRYLSPSPRRHRNGLGDATWRVERAR